MDQTATDEIYKNLINRLKNISQLNRQVADIAILSQSNLEPVPESLREYSNKLDRLSKELKKKASLIDRIQNELKEQGEAAKLSSEKSSDAATIGLNVKILEDVILTTRSDKIKLILTYAENKKLQDALLGLEISRLKFVRDCAILALEKLGE